MMNMKTFLKNAAKIVFQSLLVAAIIAPVAAYAVSHPLNFVQTPSITLYSSISGTATSMRVTPYPVDLDGNKLTIASFGTNPTLTVDPKVKNTEEIISFTAITDNGDNTATLTGLSRDLASQYPYTTTGTGKNHSAGAIVVFSNNPQMYNRLAGKENDETISGNWTFTGNTTFTNFPVTPSNTLATYSVTGVSVLATPAQQAAGTASSSNSGNPALVLAAANATSTFNTATAANKVVVTGVTGKIDSNFIGSLATTTQIGAFTAYSGIGKQGLVFSTAGATTTFTVPTGVTSVFVEVQGGGGDGGASQSGSQFNGKGGGGGSGAYISATVNVTGTTTVQVFVGNDNQWSTFGTNGAFLSAGAGLAGNNNTAGTGGTATASTTKTSVVVSNPGGSGQGGYGPGNCVSNCGSGAFPGTVIGAASFFGGGGYGAGAGSDGGGRQGVVIVRW